jgi:hypothetical protein
LKLHLKTTIQMKRRYTSAKNISVWAEWLRKSGRTPSDPSETPRRQMTLRPAPIPCVALHIALRSRFRRFFSLCRYPIVNEHSGILANCDHTSEWVHWVHQQTDNRSVRPTQTSQTLRLPSPVLLSTSKCFLAPLELCKVLSDSARAFSGAPEYTCSYGGAFRTLQDLTLCIIFVFLTVTRFPTS